MSKHVAQGARAAHGRDGAHVAEMTAWQMTASTCSDRATTVAAATRD
jgi:hypothetical protein